MIFKTRVLNFIAAMYCCASHVSSHFLHYFSYASVSLGPLSTAYPWHHLYQLYLSLAPFVPVYPWHLFVLYIFDTNIFLEPLMPVYPWALLYWGTSHVPSHFILECSVYLKFSIDSVPVYCHLCEESKLNQCAMCMLVYYM